MSSSTSSTSSPRDAAEGNSKLAATAETDEEVKNGMSEPLHAKRESALQENEDSSLADTDRDSQAKEGLRRYDILTGRGSGPNQSQGNTLFRQMVWETYQEYLQSLEKNGHAVSSFRRPMDGNIKNLLARQILSKVQDNRGRFLRRICKEDFRNLSEDEKARIVRVPLTPTSISKSPVKKKPQDDDDSSQLSTQRVNLYVELSPKETLEKIKQSLRFQVDRCEQQQLKKNDLHKTTSGPQASPYSLKPPPHKEELSRKRIGTDSALLHTFGGLGGSLPPPKKRAVPMGEFGSHSSMMGVASPVASSIKPLSLDLAQKLLEMGRAGQNQPLTSLTSNHGTMDFSSLGQSVGLEAGRFAGLSSSSNRPRSGSLPAAPSALQQLQQLQKYQEEDEKKRLWNALSVLRTNEAPSSNPPTPTTLRSTTQLEALSRLLLQEQMSASSRREQELKMAMSLVEQQRNLNNSVVSDQGNNDAIRALLLSNPSPAVTRALLSSAIQSSDASLRQTFPIENVGSNLNNLNRRSSIPGTLGASSSGVSESFLRQLYQGGSVGGFTLDTASTAASSAAGVAPLAPSLIPSVLSSSQGGGQRQKTKNDPKS